MTNYAVINSGGIKSTNNSTTSPLSGAATFTGTWENIAPYAAITINGGADVAGTLYAEFNSTADTNGDDYRVVQLSNGTSGAWGIHCLARVATYFRVRIVNGASAQSTMTVETYLSHTPLIAQPTSRAAQVVNDYSDVLNVRVLSDVALDEANSKQSDRSVVQKFGLNPDVGAGTTEDIWYGGGIYTGFLQSSAAVRIRAGGNVNDDTAGTGARSIRIEGLDENWNSATEDLVTAGASASSATTTTFIRVFRAYVMNSGTYNSNNAGDIVIETTAGTVVAAIEAADGQTQICVYSVPAGKKAFIRRLGVSVESSKPTTVKFFQHQNADDVSAPFTGTRLVFAFAGLAGVASENFEAYIGPFPAKTDIWARATGPTGGAAISATMDIVLVTA